MQQAIVRRDVYEPSANVAINGETVDVASVKVDRAMPDPLARGELRSAEAQIVAVDGPDVTSTVATPWDPASQWPPAKESPASVEFDTGAGPVKSLTNGRVLRSDGGTDDRPVYVEVLDQYQSLDQTISWGPVAEAMPSESEGVIARYVGMQSVAVTDMILRHCGWYSTPSRLPWNALSVPAQGTLWPEVGTVVTANRASDGGGYPGWLNAPWGVGVVDTDATYILGGPGYTLGTRGRVELVAMTAPRPGEGTSRIDILSDTGALLLRMSWSETSGHLYVRQGGAMVAAASVPRADGMLYATVERLSDTSVHAIIRSGGASTSATATVDSAVTTSVMREARIVANSVCGGFQIATPVVTGRLVGWEPNAVLYPRTASRNTLYVLPPVEGRSCVDLLAQQCEAECATYWIDELGILRWWDLARLESQPVVASITGSDDITRAGFKWSNDPSTVKSRVSVKWQESMRDWSWRTSVDLWQGSGQTIQPNTATVADPTEDWISVPNDEVWIMPSLSTFRAGDAGASELNNGLMSHHGGVLAGSGDDADVWAQTVGSLQFTVERVTDTAFKTRTIWTGPTPVVQRLPSEQSTSFLWQARRNMNLPIIRGKAKFTFAERFTYSAQSGPATAPEHTINAGFWIQRPEQAQYTADYAGARMTIQQPTISEFPVVMIPGLQIGDMVEAVESDVSRLTIRGLVTVDSRALAAGVDMQHSIAIRPTHVSRNGITWREWAVMTPGTWASWATSEGGTWQQWGSNPLNT